VPVTYVSHITGHGLLKLMRSPKSLTYRISRLPPVPEVLSFLAAQAQMAPRAAYSTLNMGAGLAIYCRPGTSAQVVEIAEAVGIDALAAGAVEDGPRRIVLEPLDIAYAGDDLRLSPPFERSPPKPAPTPACTP
jgi:phosphoribosylformylglycinamidine cyclo-ligase